MTCAFFRFVLLIGAAATLAAGAVQHPLAANVTIRRDNYGVPHILAKSEEAAAFGMGWAQAEDHCIEIARRFVGSRGDQAKYLGGSPDSDFFVKRYGVYSRSKANFSKLSPVLQAMMTAYADAFNLYVETHREDLPSWIPKFDAIDVVAQGRAQITRFAFPRAVIDTIVKKYPESGGVASIAPPREELPWGSNMWAIAPSRSKSGHAMLLGNPHQPWAALYWEAQITVPGKINFFGGTFVGSPVLTTGFNEHLGWTHTVNYPDLDDIYVLNRDPEHTDHYIYDGKSMPLSKSSIDVEVRQPDGTLKTVTRTYEDTHLGPVVHHTKDRVFALKSATLAASEYAEEWYALSKASNWNEFHSILKRNEIPMFNLTYADAAGNIFYLWNGTVPKRIDDGTDYRFEVPGDPKHVWTSLHSTDELPQLFDPKGGYVQNCNAPPWWTSLTDPLDPSKYPSYFEPGRPLSLRTMMSLRLLESQPKLSLADIQRLKFDPHVLLADRVKPDLLAAIRAVQPRNPVLTRAAAILDAWDNTSAAKSRGAALFLRFWETYSHAVPQPYARPWSQRNATSTPVGLSEPRVALDHLEKAMDWMRTNYGSEDAVYGDIYRIRLGDVDLPADGTDGIYGSFHVLQYARAKDGKYVAGTVDPEKPFAGGGDGWIMTIEFAKPVTAYSLLAYGETSDPKSRHSTDQARLFADHQFKPVRFYERDIQSHLERKYHPGE